MEVDENLSCSANGDHILPKSPTLILVFHQVGFFSHSRKWVIADITFYDLNLLMDFRVPVSICLPSACLRKTKDDSAGLLI